MNKKCKTNCRIKPRFNFWFDLIRTLREDNIFITIHEIILTRARSLLYDWKRLCHVTREEVSLIRMGDCVCTIHACVRNLWWNSLVMYVYSCVYVYRIGINHVRRSLNWWASRIIFDNFISSFHSKYSGKSSIAETITVYFHLSNAK